MLLPMFNMADVIAMWQMLCILVQALVLTKLDYCNSLLTGAAKYQLDKMQRIQNMACRITCNLAKFDHIRTCMADLHWLCIPRELTNSLPCIQVSTWTCPSIPTRTPSV